jgi:hypothetical protein
MARNGCASGLIGCAGLIVIGAAVVGVTTFVYLAFYRSPVQPEQSFARSAPLIAPEPIAPIPAPVAPTPQAPATPRPLAPPPVLRPAPSASRPALPVADANHAATPPAPAKALPVPVTPAPGPLTVAEASANLDSARFAAMNAVDASPKFKIAKARVDALASELEQARQGDDAQAKLDASAAWNSARFDYDTARSAAITTDPGVRTAQAILDRADGAARLAVQQAAAAEAERSRQAAAAAAAAEEERMKDPIYRAVKEHKVTLGMTEDQVIQAWGKPTSTSRTATTFGTSDVWVYGLTTGICFSDGKVISVTQLNSK